MSQYPVQTCLGKFQNRNNRLVIIKSSEMIEETVSGQKVQRRIWHGDLLKADGKTVDTAGQWEDNGAVRNQRGVACPADLNILVEADPVPVQIHPRIEAAAPLPVVDGAVDRDFGTPSEPRDKALNVTMGEGVIHVGSYVLTYDAALDLIRSLEMAVEQVAV